MTILYKLVILLSLAVIPDLPAADSSIYKQIILNENSPKMCIQTADSLFLCHMYQPALIAFYRELYQDIGTDSAFLFARIAQCHLELHHFDVADSFFVCADHTKEQPDTQCRRRRAVALLMFMHGNISASKRWINLCDSSAGTDSTILLQMIILQLSGTIHSAADSIPEKYIRLFPEVSTALRRYTVVTNSGNTRPILYGTASALLPGMGQLLAGDPIDALNSFIVNAICIGGTMWAYSRNYKAALAPGIFLSFHFYKGSIYNAARTAEKHWAEECTDTRTSLFQSLSDCYHPTTAWTE